jgi:hypothetical protein
VTLTSIGKFARGVVDPLAVLTFVLSTAIARRYDQAALYHGVGGTSTAVAEADFVASTVLVAVKVTLCAVEIGFGGVYRPLAVIFPIPVGVMFQLTDEFGAFVTFAVNAICSPAETGATPGLTVTPTLGIVIGPA